MGLSIVTLIIFNGVGIFSHIGVDAKEKVFIVLPANRPHKHLNAGSIEEQVQVVYGYPMYLSHVFGDRGDGFGGRSYEYHPLTTMGFQEIQKLLIRHMSQLKKRTKAEGMFQHSNNHIIATPDKLLKDLI